MYLALSGKVPRHKGPWRLTEKMPQGNVGETLEGKTVIDFDVKDAGREFYKLHQELCTVIVETRRGVHFHFAGETQARKFSHGDLKSGPNCYVVIPPSVVKNFQYRWIRQGELQPFSKVEPLFPQKEIQPKVSAETDSYRRIVRAKAYGTSIVCIPNGTASNTLFRFCCWMRDLGLTKSEAFSVLLAWNDTNCFQADGVTPFPWTIPQLERKLNATFR